MKMNGVNINHKDKDHDGWKALIWTCSNGLTEVVLELLKVDGLDVNIQDSFGRTALIIACSKGHTEVALELLKVDGLDVNIQDSNGWTALIWAGFRGHVDTALELLGDPRVDRNVITAFKRNALGWARRNGLTAVVTLIEALDRGNERMPLVKVHHRYLHGDVAAEGAQAQAKPRIPPGRRSRKYS